ncbi:hypothetical protein H0H93_014540, partial [Arthromyces matolae]
MSVAFIEAGDPPSELEVLDDDVPSDQIFEDEDKVVKNGMIEAKFQEIAAGNTGIKKDQRQYKVDGVIIVGGVAEENR